jgi:hypothetical protein
MKISARIMDIACVVADRQIFIQLVECHDDVGSG